VRDATSKPINVLARPDLTLKEIVSAGAQRISVGGSLTWTATEAMAHAAERIRDEGDFSALASPGRVRQWLAE
jgi:2-methylisocitrate lyase-like PEP mutase family enzyme